ncbi:OmpA family protein [Nitratireductor luteus]|uniref:OmpA family protein n=1 Tax=Nitratireductor luteus TaxID=2976980 RepID=UPI0022404280|nr:OmpA family protein [Nitratireductor luteus]
MLNRRILLLSALAVAAFPAQAPAQAKMPSGAQIQRSLEAAPRMRIQPNNRVTVEQFKRRPDLRRAAPSIDIQAINFGFDSAEIPPSEYREVEQIARALHGILRRRPGTRILLEGHTDAVGSYGYNQQLSERRARSLRRVLVRRFGLPAYALETVGYGEEYLLVQTPYEDWRNRRVTLRRIDDFIR